MSTEFDLTSIMTDWHECLCLLEDKIDIEIVERAELARFDQLPVIERWGKPIGIIDTQDARKIVDEGKLQLSRDDFEPFESTEELVAHLGYRSSTHFNDRTGSIATLRNKVMHPVRPLILSHEDVRKHKETLDVVLHLSERLKYFSLKPNKI